MFANFNFIFYLTLMNLTFVLQHGVTFYVTLKLKRFYQFPTILHFTDTLLFFSSIFILFWLINVLEDGIYVAGSTPESTLLRMQNNLRINIDFKLQYFFSVHVVCLAVRLS